MDESILGGLVVRIGDRLIDGSTRSQAAGAQAASWRESPVVTAIDKAEVERKLDAEWQTCQAVESFRTEELEAPGVVEEWSVKDLLGHMAFWANKAAHDLDASCGRRRRRSELAGGRGTSVDAGTRASQRRERTSRCPK